MDDEVAASVGEATVVGGVALLLMAAVPASFGTDALRSPEGPASAPGAVEAWEVQVVAAGFEDCTSVATPAAANFARQTVALASTSSTEREARPEEVEAHTGSPCVSDTTSGIRAASSLLFFAEVSTECRARRGAARANREVTGVTKPEAKTLPRSKNGPVILRRRVGITSFFCVCAKSPFVYRRSRQGRKTRDVTGTETKGAPVFQPSNGSPDNRGSKLGDHIGFDPHYERPPHKGAPGCTSPVGTVLDGVEKHQILRTGRASSLHLMTVRLENGRAMREVAADPRASLGGAVSALGKLVLTNTVVSGNRAVNGGGLYTEGEVEVHASLLQHNTAARCGASSTRS